MSRSRSSWGEDNDPIDEWARQTCDASMLIRPAFSSLPARLRTLLLASWSVRRSRACLRADALAESLRQSGRALPDRSGAREKPLGRSTREDVTRRRYEDRKGWTTTLATMFDAANQRKILLAPVVELARRRTGRSSRRGPSRTSDGATSGRPWAGVWRSGRADPGDLDQVDGRALPGRGRSRGGGGADANAA